MGCRLHDNVWQCARIVAPAVTSRWHALLHFIGRKYYSFITLHEVIPCDLIANKSVLVQVVVGFNSLRPRQNRRHFADDIFKCIFFYENVRIVLKISLKFVAKVRINNVPPLVQIMAWRRPGDKPLSEPMMVSLLMHICVTQPQWVKSLAPWRCGSNFKSIIFKLIIQFTE